MSKQYKISTEAARGDLIPTLAYLTDMVYLTKMRIN